MVAPAEAAVTAERVRDLGQSMNIEPNAFIARATNAGEASSARAIVASGDAVAVAVGVPREESARHLAVQPLPHQARVAAGVVGELVGGRGLDLGQRPVQPELVAEPHPEAQRAAGHVPDHLAHELLELRLVDALSRVGLCHVAPPSLGQSTDCPCARRARYESSPLSPIARCGRDRPARRARRRRDRPGSTRPTRRSWPGSGPGTRCSAGTAEVRLEAARSRAGSAPSR